MTMMTRRASRMAMPRGKIQPRRAGLSSAELPNGKESQEMCVKTAAGKMCPSV